MLTLAQYLTMHLSFYIIFITLIFTFQGHSRSNVMVVLDSPIYDFLLIICPNSAPLQDTKLWNLSDLDFDLSRSLNVKCDHGIGLSIYGFLLIHIYSNYMFISHRLAVIATQNISSYLLSSVPNYEKWKGHRVTSKWSRTLCIQGQRYPVYVELLPTSPNDFSIGFNGKFEIFEKKIVKNWKLKISKIPNKVLWGWLGGKFRTNLKRFGCEL